ncbi:MULTISPECIES: phage holin family protein [Thermomonospora]|uniref:Putative membrane protein YqjE n=1 Tax=Thermomonospora cellulosilytica TaxID=1411118 RepID=A0A7W3MU17_9ACTN|nr:MULTISPECIES: phage holin family protein [Thermomonospora]MBA9001896.1 putative membrane protein YqjE [Thermomonospora cellulosilytica]
MAEAGPGERIEDKSLGELVAQASSGISKLIRAEISLAKTELRVDARKAAVGGALFFVSLAVFAPVIIFLGLALAYGLMELFGMWPWAAFLTVAITYVVVAVLLGVVGVLVVKRIRGAKRTRRTLRDLPEAFRHEDKPALSQAD